MISCQRLHQYRNGTSIIIIVLFVTILYNHQIVQAHLTSKNFDLQSLATLTTSKLEAVLFNQIENHNQKFLKPIKMYLFGYQTWYKALMKGTNYDLRKYLENPVNEFLLMKRLGDLRRVLDMAINQEKNNTNETQHYSEDLFGSNFRKLLPGLCAVSDAALGLVQLQTTYELATQDLADGKLFPSSKFLSYHRMTAGDCWLMGRQAYMIGEDKTAISWMEESLRRYKNESENEKTVYLKDVLKYYAFSSYNQGNVSMAYNLTQQLIKLLPGGNAELLKIMESETRKRASSIKETAHANHDDDYKALCRGEVLMDTLTESKLHCSYTRPKELSAYMVLQPLKREQVSLNPPITVFYDFLSDKEIEILKELAQPKLVAGTDSNSMTGETELNQRRVYLVAKLPDEDHNILKKVSLRIQDVSGLALTNTFSRIMQYGVGGHFVPHWDYALNETLITQEGNTIATWIAYLNDVESGGATVFTEVKARVRPVKGSAAFWYNLLPNGNGNPRTKHAGCPVLSGSKWVLIRTFGLKKQEFRRQCRLNFDAEI